MTIISIIICALLILFSETAMAAAHNGLDIFLTSVFPSLFPFFVSITIMIKCGFSYKIPSFISKLLHKLNLPQYTFHLYFMSMLSGAPTSAKLLSGFVENGIMNRKTAQAILPALSVSAPLFVIGTLATTMLNTPALALPILISNYIVSFIFYIVLLRRNYIAPTGTISHFTKATKSYLVIFTDSVYESMLAMIRICGTIVFFTVIIAFISSCGIFDIKLFPEINSGIFISSLLEMTSGCITLSTSNLPLPYIAAFASFITSFCGICIYAQSCSFIESKPANYFSTKLLQAIFSALIAYIFTTIFINPETSSVFSSFDNIAGENQIKSNIFTTVFVFAISLFISSLMLIYGSIMNKLRMHNNNLHPHNQ